MLIGQRQNVLATLSNTLKKAKVGGDEKTKRPQFHTRHRKPQDTPTAFADLSDEELDVLALNTFIFGIQKKWAKDKSFVLQATDFVEFEDAFIDKDRAQAFEHMMLCSNETWWNFSSSEFAKVGSKYTQHLFQAYEYAKHVWAALELSEDAKNLYQEICGLLDQEDLWPQKAGWTFDESKIISTNDEETLDYLAPFQRQLAVSAKDDIQTKVINKMNCILSDALSVAGIPINGKITVPEEVMLPFRQFIHVSNATLSPFSRS